MRSSQLTLWMTRNPHPPHPTLHSITLPSRPPSRRLNIAPNRLGLALDDAGTMFRQIVHGLMYLDEEAEIVHGDIKLESILLDKMGMCRFADFGLAKLIPPLLEAPQTSERARVCITITKRLRIFHLKHATAPSPRLSPHAARSSYVPSPPADQERVVYQQVPPQYVYVYEGEGEEEEEYGDGELYYTPPRHKTPARRPAPAPPKTVSFRTPNTNTNITVTFNQAAPPRVRYALPPTGLCRTISVTIPLRVRKIPLDRPMILSHLLCRYRASAAAAAALISSLAVPLPRLHLTSADNTPRLPTISPAKVRRPQQLEAVQHPCSRLIFCSPIPAALPAPPTSTPSPSSTQYHSR